ncbi:hypothetical protein RM844_13060 [Streptomyces sp. DSM 44915]|uniref:Uncharacterized protein n=1 Tax=Streptomyces chisholmiae TaxID=3075540 RepID=A0ABU2JR37_9ACTN|nr:hypothetical protein [Streptomyces sp. DSM 44915]MDT0267216.1 hypothetical protein [Streptomyces sp. DSM 44915]
MAQTHYAERRSWNPLSPAVQLTEWELRIGGERLPLDELHLVAMAEAWLRGRWMGGGGTERPLSALPQGPGRVPVIRISGAARPLKVRNAAAFAAALGPLAVRRSGGQDQVRRAEAEAAGVGVPLWIARRQAPGPHGQAITVAVDRRLVRADVWSAGAPQVRLRGGYGRPAGFRGCLDELTVTVGPARATLEFDDGWRGINRSVGLGHDGSFWTLTPRNSRSSQLTRNGRPVATLTAPRPAELRRIGDRPMPLADVRHESFDPLDAVLAHLFAVAFGLGEANGAVRFGGRRALPHPSDPVVWEQPWYTGLRQHRHDSGPGGAADGWGGDGGGAEGGGADGGGGDGGGDGGGGGGGDGGDGGGGGGGGGE